MVRFLHFSLLPGLACGLVAAGCSGGGGGGSGSTAAPITGVGSSLPSADRSANGYVFSALAVGSTPDGALTALAPLGTNALALRAPDDDVLRVAGASAVSESAFPAPGSSLAAVGTTAWAGTGDRAAQGAAGRVYVRGGVGTWSLALDTGLPEAHVAATASGALALGGGEGLVGRVWRLGAGAPVEVAALQSGVPAVAASYVDGLYVGGTSNDVGGGGARLYRISGSGSPVEVALPLAAQAQQGVRQQVTAMLSVDGAPGAALSRVLLLAIGSFDLQTGQGQGGWVMAGDGAQFEVLTSFGGEAPTALAWIDRTVYAGTTGGRVVYRDSNGQWVDESGLPQNDGVHSLLAKDAGTLLIGARGAQGARLFTRTVGTTPPASGGTTPPPAGGTTPPPAGGGVPPAGRDVFYQSDVKFLIQSSCVQCHGDPNNQAAYSVYAVSRLPDDFASYQATKDHVDTTDVQKSILLGKITNQIPHVGGAQVQVGDSTYNLVYNWILQGARRDVTGSNPPYNYFTEIKPTVDKGCFGCHFNGAGGYNLGGNYQDNYNELLQELDLANPRNSVFIRVINGTMNHTGGVAFAPNSAEENRIVAWINAGRPFQ